VFVYQIGHGQPPVAFPSSQPDRKASSYASQSQSQQLPTASQSACELHDDFCHNLLIIIQSLLLLLLLLLETNMIKSANNNRMHIMHSSHSEVPLFIFIDWHYVLAALTDLQYFEYSGIKLLTII